MNSQRVIRSGLGDLNILYLRQCMYTHKYTNLKGLHCSRAKKDIT
jgi:hypothetical protein